MYLCSRYNIQTTEHTDIIPPDTMTILPLTYTRDAATCPTFGVRTAEAVGGIGRAKITPP